MASMPYVLSQRELLQSKHALLRSTATEKAYRAYFASVAQYLALSESVPPRIALGDGDAGSAITLRLHESVLSKRKYLIGFVEDAWFAGTFPSYDAIASIVQNDSYYIPPLVLVPRRQMRFCTEMFRSILEHELVHVNQAIRGTLPFREPQAELDAAISTFFGVVRSEFDANLLQLARWPKFFPHERVPSLEFWCVLRGLAEALESAVTGAFCSAKMLTSLLSALRDAFDDGLAKCKVHGSLVNFFKRGLPHFVSTAVSNRIESQPALVKNASIEAAQQWLRSCSAKI